MNWAERLLGGLMSRKRSSRKARERAMFAMGLRLLTEPGPEPKPINFSQAFERAAEGARDTSTTKQDLNTIKRALIDLGYRVELLERGATNAFADLIPKKH